MHGAGYGTCDNSFGDIAYDLSSAGFVTAVLDKPVWSTNDATRDYPGSAAIYDQVITYLRSLDNVSETKVGIYATSESTWISSYLLQQDHDVAFQVLLSPWSTRHDIRWDFLPRRISRWLARMTLPVDRASRLQHRSGTVRTDQFRYRDAGAAGLFDTDAGGLRYQGCDDRTGRRHRKNRGYGAQRPATGT